MAPWPLACAYLSLLNLLLSTAVAVQSQPVAGGYINVTANYPGKNCSSMPIGISMVIVKQCPRIFATASGNETGSSSLLYTSNRGEPPRACVPGRRFGRTSIQCTMITNLSALEVPEKGFLTVLEYNTTSEGCISKHLLQKTTFSLSTLDKCTNITNGYSYSLSYLPGSKGTKMVQKIANVSGCLGAKQRTLVKNECRNASGYRTIKAVW